MDRNDRDYILGENVTRQAHAQERRETVVVSFRVSAKDFDMLGRRADMEGKTVSQVAREALHIGLSSLANSAQSSASISLPNGSTFRWGDESIDTSGTQAETDLPILQAAD